MENKMSLSVAVAFSLVVVWGLLAGSAGGALSVRPSRVAFTQCVIEAPLIAERPWALQRKSRILRGLGKGAAGHDTPLSSDAGRGAAYIYRTPVLYICALYGD